MKTLVGVFVSHADAIKAIENLKKTGFNEKKVSLISKADVVNDHIHVKSDHTVEKAEVSVGVAAGAILGILTGVGIFAIPGLGFLYGAGALVGVIAGLDFGLMGGGLLAILTSVGVDGVNSAKYEKHLNEGKYLVFAQGSPDEIEKAEKIVGDHNLHLELSVH